MNLSRIGFYTLSDERVGQASETSPLSRCELILTDRCNFNCPYCRGPKHDRDEFMPYSTAQAVVQWWGEQGLKAIRFSGGEPTLYPELDNLIALAREQGIERIAISTNGSATLDRYLRLVDLGVNDFSISLDSFNPKGVQEMSGGFDVFDRIVSNIRGISKLTYVTVGMVFTHRNVGQSMKAVEFAHSLGVSDIRVLSSAQFNQAIEALENLPEKILDRHPILRYRIENFRKGRNVRGLAYEDSNRCSLVLDDMAIAGEYHFPCIIYLREGGDPIGKISSDIRSDRAKWSRIHDTQADPICSRNCLDVCIDYNNKARELAKL